MLLIPHKIIKCISYVLLFTFGGISDSCEGDGIANQGEAIAKYKDQVLYQKEVREHLPRDLKEEDSSRLVRIYVEDWLMAKVLEDKALSTIPNLEKTIEPKVNSFKKQLIEYEYMRYVTQRELYKAISPQEVRNYYLQNTDKFISEASYFSFFYVKSAEPIEASRVAAIRSKDPESLEELIAWCNEQEEMEFKLDSLYTTEKELDLVKQGFPLDIKRVPTNQVYSYNYKDPNSGTVSNHLFKLLDIVKEGERKPFSMCQEEIRGIILNQRKRKLLDQTKTWLVDQAKLNRDIEIY